MKKITINISDFTYEKFRFESLEEKKSIPDIIKERIFYKEFSKEVEHAIALWMDQEINKIIKD
jgi:hypothetical protein